MLQLNTPQLTLTFQTGKSGSLQLSLKVKRCLVCPFWATVKNKTASVERSCITVMRGSMGGGGVYRLQLMCFNVSPPHPGVPAGPQCHHSQFAAGSGAVESHHTQMGSPGRAQNIPMNRERPQGPNGPSGPRGPCVHRLVLSRQQPHEEHQSSLICPFRNSHVTAHKDMTQTVGPNDSLSRFSRINRLHAGRGSSSAPFWHCYEGQPLPACTLGTIGIRLLYMVLFKTNNM